MAFGVHLVHGILMESAPWGFFNRVRRTPHPWQPYHHGELL